MKKGILILSSVFILFSCQQEKAQENLILQGDWYKDGFTIKAFTFKGDSMFFPGLEKPFPYQIRKDTLIIQFEEMETRSIFLSSSSSELVMWDETLTKDTIHFDRIPDILVEETKKK